MGDRQGKNPETPSRKTSQKEVNRQSHKKEGKKQTSWSVRGKTKAQRPFEWINS